MAGGRKRPGPPEGPPEPDLDLWRQVTRDAKPLKGRDGARPGAPESGASPGSPKKATKKAAKPRARPSEPAPEPKPELRPGGQADLDKRQAERLRRGKLPIEARLDLHGHRQEDARAALADFLADCQGAGLRCVLVITGKGEGREGGVLRQSLPGWLNQPPNRARIVAFTPAQPKHGGHGAVYVLIKRRRA